MEQESIPHVLIFPYFAQGHINSMLKLAELLCLSGFHVTFLNSEKNHHRLLRYTDIQSRFSRFPGSIRLRTITDVFPVDHTGTIDILDFNDLITALTTNVRPAFREFLISDSLKSDDMPPVTCIISDGILGFTIDIGEELGIPVISFRTVSASCYWIYFCFSQLIESGDLPFNDDDLDRRVTSVTEMESFLRRRDLPSACRAKELTDPGLQFVKFEALNSARASAHILNTFEDLEGPILTQIRSYCPNHYTLGPLHALLRSRSKDYPPSNASNSLWEEDRSCMTWLDSQPDKSVVYVSFGSLAKVSRAELFELWFGLVNSGQRFLWVRRTDSIVGVGKEDEIPPVELVEGTEERGFIVGWAPQEEVLEHPAVGGFLTHSGWNSTLESLAAGVPMICWPQFGDQMIISRYVSEVWKLGMDMKDTCDRSTVEKLVRDMMEDDDTLKREELMKSTAKMVEMAKKAVCEGGSSYVNFDGLVNRIREMSTHAKKLKKKGMGRSENRTRDLLHPKQESYH